MPPVLRYGNMCEISCAAFATAEVFSLGRMKSCVRGVCFFFVRTTQQLTLSRMLHSVMHIARVLVFGDSKLTTGATAGDVV